jgi:hypothetical protein
MEYVIFGVRFLSYCILVVFAGVIAFLVYNGDISLSPLQEWLTRIAPSIGQGASSLAILALAFCFFLTAVAPFIYAARSGDFFTVIVSIVALVVCFVLLANSRTVIDMVLAAIVYFTSALISVVMFSTNKIAAEVRGKARNASSSSLD